ncbi:MAG: dihydroorotase [Treponemataceae bacterium]|nr:dihydroorotase [Treponemataceae bacterium]
MTHALLIYNARLLDEATDSPGALLAVNGKIRALFHGYFTNFSTVERLAKAVMAEDGCKDDYGIEAFDARRLTVTPAFIDMHVHLRDPGQTHKEDLNSGLHAAVAGGYGTVVAMPNTAPVVSSAEAALEVNRRAEELRLARVIQSVSITSGFGGIDISHLDKLDAGQVPLITEDGHEVASAAIMLAAMKKAAQRGIIVSCHCEDPELAAAARTYRVSALAKMLRFGLSASGADEKSALRSVPKAMLEEIDVGLEKANRLLALAENTATERNIALAREAGCAIHIAHISTARAIEAVRNAKLDVLEEQGYLLEDAESDAYDDAFDAQSHADFSEQAEDGAFRITCEATPHHIALCGDEEPFIRAIVNPPLRPESDRFALLEAIRDGLVDVISTDHAPHTPPEKSAGSPGFTGLETAYAVCNTVLVRGGHIDARRLSQLMSANPARLLGLNKGILKSGCDADIAVVDPDEEWTVDPSLFCSKGRATPFEGRTLVGKVRNVFLAGLNIFEA